MRFPWQPDANDSEGGDSEGGDPEGASTFIRLEDGDAVDAFLAQREPEPSVLLIHDPWCPISGRAFGEAAKAGTTIHLVLTGDGQHLSARIAAATGIRHESPQVFVLAGGQVTWHASHFRISRGAILDGLTAARGAAAL